MDASGGAGGHRMVGLPATEIAARVRSGEWSAVDVVRAHLAHLDAVEPRIGAFRVVRREAALAEAAAVDADPGRSSMPLAGVPIAVKDNTHVAGEVITYGSSAASTAPARSDAPVVGRLRSAGAVVVGITRVPELWLYATTDAPGAVSRNPWDTARTPGGSSGGAAAAVASGAVPLAQGNDGMGSLRIPAAACGVVTLKPGRGVMPGPLGADSWSGMATDGAFATTVADVAVATAVMAGEEPSPPTPPGGPLRIAVSTRSAVPGVRPDTPTRAALDGVVRQLRDAGHVVVERHPRIPQGARAGAFARWMAGGYDDAEHLGLDPAKLQPRSRTHVRIGRLAKRARLVRPGTAERFRERTAAFFDDVEVLLTPVTSGPPLPARPWHERSFVANITANARWAPWVSAWNLAGVPALVLPAGRRPDGMPVAVQFVGPPGAERRLLWLAEELERRQPWRRHAPLFDPAALPATTPA